MQQYAKKIKLTNGLNVIYEHNDNAEIVSVQIAVKVGSVNETDDESGICHLIEHMVFKGTTSFKAGEIATIVEAHGGELNAYTSLDQTVYYINVPSRHFGLALKIIKEMAFDAGFDATELAREKEVVIEEIRRGQDSPHRVLGETLFKMAFNVHPYGRPVIGTDENVRGFSSEKILGFYKRHYTPQNMILGVCGNISESELSRGLEDLFRFQLASPMHDPDITPEPAKTESVIATKSMEINATYLDIAFAAPRITHPDVPALDVLSHLLGESDTSLLEQTIREKENLVHSIYTSCYTPKYPGLFMIGAHVDPKNINKALHSIKEKILMVQDRLFEDEKIERAKLIARSQIIYEKQTCEGTARKWLTYETTAGDYNFDENYLEKISKLTTADIQKVAREYLDFSKATVVVLHPDKVKVSIDEKIFGKKAHLAQAKATKPVRKVNDISLYRLDNGLRVILKENHRLPLVSVKTASLGGLRVEDVNNNGISQLLSVVMTRSTKNLSQLKLAEQCEWLAGDVSGYTGRNSLGFSFTFLSEKLYHAFDLFADVVKNPAFDAEDVKKERALQLEGIRNREDNPGQLVFKVVLEKLFKNHPFRFQVSGEKKSVSKLNPAALKKFYEKIVVPKNMVIAAVGDFESEKMLALIKHHFGNLTKKDFVPKKPAKPARPRGVEALHIHKNKQQSHVVLAFLGTSLHDKDRQAMEVLNNILSGQGGRLFLELRDKQSLAYTVTSTMVEGLDTGLFGTYIGTEPAKVDKATGEMLKELKRLKTEAVSLEELDRAKNYIIGNHEIDHQKNGTIAMQLALNELYGKKIDEFFDFSKKILSVTPEDILRVANKYITLDNYVMGVVGPTS